MVFQNLKGLSTVLTIKSQPVPSFSDPTRPSWVRGKRTAGSTDHFVIKMGVPLGKTHVSISESVGSSRIK